MIALAAAAVIGVGIFIGVTLAREEAAKPVPVFGTEESESGEELSAVEVMMRELDGLYWSKENEDDYLAILYLKNGAYYQDSFCRNVPVREVEGAIRDALGKDPDEMTLDDFYAITNHTSSFACAAYEPATGKIYSLGDDGGRSYFLWSDGKLVEYLYNYETRAVSPYRTYHRIR